ncbi:MAG: hypothetical protein K2K97_10855 [Muribaculaceae bacterium]|nr:hypothetical protein [Muribaculaceae bacterium]
MKSILSAMGLLAVAAIPAVADTAEYFIDSDPGVGSASRIEATRGENHYALPLTDILPGSHLFGIRVMDDEGRWTQTVTRPLYIADELPYAGMEYYIDEDPGKGNGTAVNHGNAKWVSFNVPTDDVAVGTHTLSVRLLDAQGKWTEALTRPFIVTQKAPDLMVEYFYDKDPGAGSARKLEAADGKNIYYLPLDENLEPGAHIFGVRCVDRAGNWTRTVVNPLYVMDKINLSKAEYYVDTDPGEGKANGVALGNDGKSAFTVPTAELLPGTHQLVMRGGDDDNSWYTLFSRPFQIIAGTSGVSEVKWLLGFDCDRTDGGIRLTSDAIPSGTDVTVVSLNGELLAQTVWADSSLPLDLPLLSSGIIIVKLSTPTGATTVKTIR